MRGPTRQVAPTLLILAFLAGCGSGGSPGRARPSLSDAVEEAKKKPEEQATVRPEKHKKEPGDHDRGVEDAPVATAAAVAEVDREPAETSPSSSAPSGTDEGLRLGIFGGGGGLSRDPRSRFGTFGLFVGSQRGRLSAGLRGGWVKPDVTDASVRSAFKNEFGMFIDGYGLLGVMPAHTFMDLGAIGVLRFGFLDWTYENPITVNEGGGPKEITGDTVGYMALMIGPTVTAARSRRFSLELLLLGGGRIYTENTLRGFQNDLFDAAWMLEAEAQLAYRRTGSPLE